MAGSDRLVILDGPADTAEIAAYERTRRDALRRGIAFGSATLAAASVPALLGARNAFAKATGDAGIVAAAVALEQAAVLTYDTATSSPHLDAATRRATERLGLQEEQHAEALTAALDARGVNAPEPPEDMTAVSGLAEASGSARDLLAFAIELELMAVAAYYDAQRRLKDPKLLQTGAQIMANEGQHLVVLRQAARQEPVPYAFETGRRSA
jgi:rubrerythrin